MRTGMEKVTGVLKKKQLFSPTQHLYTTCFGLYLGVLSLIFATNAPGKWAMPLSQDEFCPLRISTGYVPVAYIATTFLAIEWFISFGAKNIIFL
jgi:hypothetical protein